MFEQTRATGVQFFGVDIRDGRGAALLFVLGFTAVLTATTMAVLGVSGALLANEELLQRLGGHGRLGRCVGAGFPRGA